MNNLFGLIIGMAIVTYIPRFLPFILFSFKQMPSFFKRFLYFVPYAVLSALIFPEVLSATNNTSSALVGSTVALILALLEIDLSLIVIGGILGVYVSELLF